MNINLTLMLKQNVQSHTRNVDDFRLKQHRLNYFRNLPTKVGSKCINKFPRAMQTLDNPRNFWKALNSLLLNDAFMLLQKF